MTFSLIPQKLNQHLQSLIDSQHYVVAYSGGIDSHVLLHLCSKLRELPNFNKSFSAVYINHGLSENAKSWEIHCGRVCNELKIPFKSIEVNAHPKNRQSPEAAARIARYDALLECIESDQCLLTAQHLSDQAETLMLQLLRGCGVKGLASMPEVKSFGKGFLCRPILECTEKEILKYAQDNKLTWIEDESNQDEKFDRNYLRHTVFPILKNRWPSVFKTFSKVASLQAESQCLLDDLAKEDIKKALVYDQREIKRNILAIKPLSTLKHYRLKNLLRYWISINNIPVLPKKKLDQAYRKLILARRGEDTKIRWKVDDNTYEIKMSGDYFYIS